MAHPIKQLAKLAPKSSNLKSTGFGGGVAIDNLEVAAILGMHNPNTGKKLDRAAYNMGRYAYCDDKQCEVKVKSALLNRLLHEDTGKINEVVILRLILAAIREFNRPATRLNKDGAQEIVSYSKRRIAAILGIRHQSITERHEALYDICVNQLILWSNDVVNHINSHNEKD